MRDSASTPASTDLEFPVLGSNSEQFEGTAHEKVGFRGKKGQKVHPNFAPNITMLFSLPCFFSSLINPIRSPESQPLLKVRWPMVDLIRVTGMAAQGQCRQHFSQPLAGFCQLLWSIPPVRLGLSGRNSGRIPERPRKRSQSVSWNSPREYGWDPPSPIIQGI